MTRLYTNTHGHEHPSLFLFLRLPQHRNSRAAIVILKKTSQHQRERIPPLPLHFSDSILSFFTVRSNTFIYFLIKVDLCTSCDKPGIALSFFTRPPSTIHSFFPPFCPRFILIFMLTFIRIFKFFFFFFFCSFFLLLSQRVITISYDS